MLKPEWDELRAAALALHGCNGTDEDVLTYSMFPKVAPKFFASRADGPKNVGKAASEPVAAGAKPADGQAKPADGKGPITGPVTYEVHVGKNKHKVTVQPA